MDRPRWAVGLAAGAATLLDPLLFGHVPPWSSLAGGALVAGSCVAVSWVRR